MVFSSHLFLFYFLPTALALYYTCPWRWRSLLLTVLSYIFYGWANPWFVFLMLVSTAIDYCAGQFICGRWTIPWCRGEEPAGPGLPSARQRKTALVASMVSNLSLLGFFKYLGFAQTNLNYLLHLFGHEGVRVFEVVLPVGISFYTFQSMSYAIDLYRGHAKPARDFLDFACYVSLYPQLVAGPIVRYQDLADQLVERQHTVGQFAQGVLFLAFGLAKKILLANPMGEVADAAFGASALTPLQAWTGVLGYAFQIYFDFSGYSDMAIGLGLMLGFRFKRNFDLPYISQSITEFWRRWHISLSTWLRDNLYIPLGGNRLGPRRTYINLAAVMLLGGLWHGAQWTFVIWGAIHGALLALERWHGKTTLYARLPRPLPTLLTFGLVLITWVFFRAESLPAALQYLGSMFGLGPRPAATQLLDAVLFAPQYLLIFAVCVLVHWLKWDTWDIAYDLKPVRLVGAAAALTCSVAVLFTQSYNPFLYFRF
ncbi:MAG: MBOAT family protein [Armatimonadetes bacterium]|nr:MBOAT family protein [Armatimonadota bacterium]